ncbi:uncharacterized protein [Arachis hypogaea]|uniref:uncharacterized protein n=1 Tax=Arachis hypogaea TaxID=3818 RepID=UPI003B20DF31
MAICRAIGYPNLFITFTCNPQWKEIADYCKDNKLKAEDRPDIDYRMFKLKLEKLIRDIDKNNIFGRSRAEHKFPTPDDIDKIISAEIPDPTTDHEYYQAVKSSMMHGLCGSARKNSPCMENGRCIRHFPKKFVQNSTIDQDGYTSYRRHSNGRTIEVFGIDLDNRYVVPHNRFLLLRYGAHINVEWCNQSRSIKYLFKYVNKGTDRITASFYSKRRDETSATAVDEVKIFYDCRYDDNALQTIVDKATVRESMFVAWFKANKEYAVARELTYNDFPTKFVWKPSLRIWEPRKAILLLGDYSLFPHHLENYTT